MAKKGLTVSGGEYFSQNKHPWEGISSILFPAANLCCIGTSWPLPGEETCGKEKVGLLEATTTKPAFLSHWRNSGEKMPKSTVVGFMPLAFLLFHCAESKSTVFSNFFLNSILILLCYCISFLLSDNADLILRVA